MVRKYHWAPPDSSSAEKLFSAAKNVIGQSRLSMKPANMERNLFLKYGIREINYGGYGRLSNIPEDFIAELTTKLSLKTIPWLI